MGKQLISMMELLIIICMIFFLLALPVNLLMSYYSTSTYADYIVELEEKFQEKNKYWAKFYDIFSEVYLEVVVDEDIYEELVRNVRYKITYGYNNLFKTPKLKDIAVSVIE